MHVMFSFDVVALELTPWLQAASARLEATDRLVAIELMEGMAFESGFRIGRVELTDGGGIRLLRLVPTSEPIAAPTPENVFGIEKIRLEPAKHHIELKASRERSMRVQVKAAFVLTAVDLAPSFEVAAIVLQASGNSLTLRNRVDGPGTVFNVEQVELGSDGELRALRLRRAAD